MTNIDKFNEFFESYNTPVGIKWIDKNYKLIGLFILYKEIDKEILFDKIKEIIENEIDVI